MWTEIAEFRNFREDRGVSEERVNYDMDCRGEIEMPIYEYVCDRCGEKIEIFRQSAGEIEPPEQCACGRERSFTRVFSTFAAQTGAGGGDHCENFGAPGCDGAGGCGCGGHGHAH